MCPSVMLRLGRPGSGAGAARQAGAGPHCRASGSGGQAQPAATATGLQQTRIKNDRWFCCKERQWWSQWPDCAAPRSAPYSAASITTNITNRKKLKLFQIKCSCPDILIILFNNSFPFYHSSLQSLIHWILFCKISFFLKAFSLPVSKFCKWLIIPWCSVFILAARSTALRANTWDRLPPQNFVRWRGGDISICWGTGSATVSPLYDVPDTAAAGSALRSTRLSPGPAHPVPSRPSLLPWPTGY